MLGAMWDEDLHVIQSHMAVGQNVCGVYGTTLSFALDHQGRNRSPSSSAKNQAQGDSGGGEELRVRHERSLPRSSRLGLY